MFKDMRLSSFVYSIVIISFFVAIVILFFYFTNFIVKNVNKIFSLGNLDDTKTLNMEDYLRVEKKLNLPTYKKEEAPSASQGIQEQLSTSTPVTNN